MNKVNYMIDCWSCASTQWAVDSIDECLRLSCNRCGAIANHPLTPSVSGAECIRCNSETWSIHERTPDHVILECGGCGMRAEAWIRE